MRLTLQAKCDTESNRVADRWLILVAKDHCDGLLLRLFFERLGQEAHWQSGALCYNYMRTTSWNMDVTLHHPSLMGVIGAFTVMCNLNQDW